MSQNESTRDTSENPSNQNPVVDSQSESSFFGKKLTIRHLLTGRLRVVTFSFLVIALATVGVVFFVGAKPAEKQDELSVVILPVKTQPAKAVTSFEQSRVYTGTIRSKRSSELSFEINGLVVELLADEGSSVQKNDILAKLDVRALNAKKDELIARRDQAQATLDELVAGPRKETIEATRAEVKSLIAQLELAKLNLKRRKKLVESHSIAKEEYDQALYSQQATSENLNAAQKRLDELEAGTRKEKKAAQRAVVEQLNASIREIGVQLDKSILRAPYAGVIALRSLDEGSTAVATAPVFRIVESGKLEAWIGLPANVASQLQQEDDFVLNINGRDHSTTATRLIPELNSATRTRTMIFELGNWVPASDSTESFQDSNTNIQPEVIPGQIVRITIKQPSSIHGYWVPSTALVRSAKGLWSVFVAEKREGNFVVARRDIKIIENESNRSLVEGVLKNNEQVIVDGAHRVTPGQQVKPVAVSD